METKSGWDFSFIWKPNRTWATWNVTYHWIAYSINKMWWHNLHDHPFWLHAIEVCSFFQLISIFHLFTAHYFTIDTLYLTVSLKICKQLKETILATRSIFKGLSEMVMSCGYERFKINRFHSGFECELAIISDTMLWDVIGVSTSWLAIDEMGQHQDQLKWFIQRLKNIRPFTQNFFS